MFSCRVIAEAPHHRCRGRPLWHRSSAPIAQVLRLSLSPSQPGALGGELFATRRNSRRTSWFVSRYRRCTHRRQRWTLCQDDHQKRAGVTSPSRPARFFCPDRKASRGCTGSSRSTAGAKFGSARPRGRAKGWRPTNPSEIPAGFVFAKELGLASTVRQAPFARARER